jgi:hypothetical protein
VAGKTKKLVALGLTYLLFAMGGPQPVQGGKGKDDAGQKFVTLVEMRDKPWPQVLEWLADASGLPVFSGNYKPTGTFTYIAPRAVPGKPAEKKTISEVVDDLNAALRTKKFLIVRNNNAFTLIAADEPVPNSEIQRLPNVEELYKHANSELVSLFYSLKVLSADEFSTQVKKMIGPFGDVYSIPTTNTLYLKDEVATLKQIVAMIKDCENIVNRPEILAYRCEFIAARDAEQSLKAFLGDPAKSPMDGVIPMVMPQAMTNMLPGVNFPVPMPAADGPDRGGRRGAQGRLPGNQGGPSQGSGIKAVVRAITSDEQTNTVFVAGPADKLAQARALLQQIDRGSDRYVTGPPILRAYTILSGNAEAVANMLTQSFKNSDLVKIAALDSSHLLVRAFPQDHFTIARDLESSKPSSGTVKLVLNHTDASRIVDTLGKIYANGDGKAGYPYFEADNIENAIIVKGSTEQISEVRGIMNVLTDQGIQSNDSVANSKIRVIALDRGNPAALAEAVQKTLQRLRQNPVHIVDPDVQPSTLKNQKDGKREDGE